jgi:hypothetical protein
MTKAGGVAQLGERLLCKQEVIGSIPFTSTIFFLNVKRKCVIAVKSAHFRLVFDQKRCFDL